MTTDTKKTIVHRYIKDTIGSCMWEIVITESPDGEIEMWKGHMDKNGGDVIKEVKEIITRKKANEYMKKNEYYHIETYER